MFEIEIAKLKQAEIRREIATNQRVKPAGIDRPNNVLVKWGIALMTISAFAYWIGQTGLA